MVRVFQRLRNRYTVFFFDSLMVVMAWLGAYWLRFNLSDIPSTYWHAAVMTLPWIMAIQLTIYVAFGLYRGDWRYASIPDLIRIIKAVFAGSVIVSLSLFIADRNEGVPRSVLPLYILLLVSTLGGARFLYRRYREYSSQKKVLSGLRVLVIGAGQAGESLVRDLMREDSQKYLPVAFVDDNQVKQYCEVRGIPIVGGCESIPNIVKKLNIDLAIIAIPSLSSEKLRRIVTLCESAEIPFRRVPSLDDLTAGRVNISALRDISIEELLGRDAIKLDWDKITECVQNKVVLITGGGGSIGSEICRQVAVQKPKQLIIFENNEYNLYSIEMELMEKFPTLNLKALLVDVSDKNAVANYFFQYKPQLVFHAAAFKHVPMLETQIGAAIGNNIFGTYAVAIAADKYKADAFIMISTDKVVDPSNVMGASKRAAEVVCQYFNAFSTTRFMTVRFGNVLGSTGSVVPLFRKQIEMGGPVTVTHPEMTRYFMTIPEAVQLILQAVVLGKGGEIFILDMGEPVRINDLAAHMIRLAGKKVDEDIKIVYTGMRPGEKLTEKLVSEQEEVVGTPHPKIMQVHSQQQVEISINSILEELEQACLNYNQENMMRLLKQLVPEFSSMTRKAKVSLKVVMS